MLVAASDDEQVAVLYAGVEMHPSASVPPGYLVVGGKVALEIFHEHVSLFCLYVSARVVLYLPVGDADDVASYRHVAGLQLYADRCGFEGSAPFVHLVLVISENGRVCHL